MFITLQVQCAILLLSGREHMGQADGIFAESGFDPEVSIINSKESERSDLHSSCVHKHGVAYLAATLSVCGCICPGGAVMEDQELLSRCTIAYNCRRLAWTYTMSFYCFIMRRMALRWSA